MDPFRELYERYFRDVYRFALFLTGDVARAEESDADRAPALDVQVERVFAVRQVRAREALAAGVRAPRNGEHS